VVTALLLLGCSGHGCSDTETTRGREIKLQSALAAKGPGYVPRTRHKNPDGSPKYTNRLILEASPYLLQHAHNPVNWFPWGDEAFAVAKATGRPIFLSVGYSTCHWCHVMEEESFEDEEIAQYLNEHYVAIKVDREERPDVDSVYMGFVQALTGSGGWPMSVWVTASREPFFGGTYFPPRAGVHGAARGFLDVMREQSERFHDNPAGVAAEAQRFAKGLREASAPEPAGDFPKPQLLGSLAAQVRTRFDPDFGGMRGAPKFPSSFPARVLLRWARRGKDSEARRMTVETLTHMRTGGIYDQIGGGFHRYSTDARWLVPHFEKMLYDNALLATLYLEGAQATGSDEFASTAREVLDYLLREMTAPDGTFYGATDADSPALGGRREEGIFFTWTPEELRRTLGAEDAGVAASWFGVTDAGNLDGRTVLATSRSLSDAAPGLGLLPSQLADRVGRIRQKLLDARAQRPPPDRDDKVIASWNGLAISAFARAAIVLGERRYAQAALGAAQVLVAGPRAHKDLPHVLIHGQPRGSGFADDYVLFAAALLDVFELTSDPTWLGDAKALMEDVERSFRDGTNGGYFLTADSHESLLVREKPYYDGPVPSVNSVAALTWLRLYDLTGEERFRERAEATLRALDRTLTSRPLALEQALLAVDWASDAVKEIVVVVPDGRGALATAARPLLDSLARVFAPNSVLVVATEADFSGGLGKEVAWATGKTLRGGRTTAYVCERGACKLPTNDTNVFVQQLAETRPYP
jgi:uncharacterized protein YyaL (SSP411 family)